MFADDVLEATVDCLVELSGGGPAMEFAVGTGRVAVPLAARGVPVAGIELSTDMLAVLRSKPEASDITAVEGDMAVTFVEGEFSLVYLVFNTITNLTSQDEQVACFENAARHLRPGGRFVGGLARDGRERRRGGIAEECRRVEAGAQRDEVEHDAAIRNGRYARQWVDPDGAWRMSVRDTVDAGRGSGLRSKPSRRSSRRKPSSRGGPSRVKHSPPTRVVSLAARDTDEWRSRASVQGRAPSVHVRDRPHRTRARPHRVR